MEATGEEGTLLIKALCGLTRVVANVNIPNTSLQIPNLPAEAVVETNAVFERDHIHPIAAGPIKRDVYDLVIPHVENHERTLKAALTCDYDVMLRAFRRDPLVTCSKADAETLLKTMIRNTKKYLPEGWQNL